MLCFAESSPANKVLAESSFLYDLKPRLREGESLVQITDPREQDYKPGNLQEAEGLPFRQRRPTDRVSRVGLGIGIAECSQSLTQHGGRLLLLFSRSVVSGSL